MKIRCDYKKLVPLGELKPHPKNRNQHPADQIARLAQVIEYQGFRHPVIVSNLSGFIVAGHGRLAAAEKLKLKEVPVDYQDFESEEQEYAFLVSDNAVALWAELDLSGINSDVGDLGPDFNIDWLGIKDFTLDVAEKGDLSLEEVYTQKIEAPIYEPKGERPLIKDLYDLTKASELITEIKSSNIPEEIKEFLIKAANRHTIFSYEKIAEFYAHANKDIQHLMERSALVIIDFNKAIENGFIEMTKEISETYPSTDE